MPYINIKLGINLSSFFDIIVKRVNMNITNKEKLTNGELNILENLLQDLKEDYLYELNLTGLKGIKIVFDNYLHSDSDGRLENNEVLLPCSKTKKALSNNYDDNYESLKSTVYHELIHLDFRNKYPNLHDLYDKLVINEEYNKAVPILIWVEFNVESKNDVIYNGNVAKRYLDSIINYKWDFSNEEDFKKLKKHLPYIITRLNGKYLKKEEYLKQIKHEYLKKVVVEVEKILYKLSKQEYIDDYAFIKELCEYLDNEQSRYG